MGKTGRLIKEKEWPFQADWYSMLFSIAGTGFVLERDNECAPVTTQDPRTVEVKSGYVISPTGTVRYFPGNTVEHDTNTGKYPRLDLLYLRVDPDDSTKMELVMEKGTPAERPKAPQLPHPDTEEVVPVAVVGFQEYMDQIHDLFDARSVMDSEHHHGAGDALQLDGMNAEMSVKTDGTTITTQDGQLEVVRSGIGPGDLNINWEKGLEENTSGGIRVKKGYGLRFDHAESVAVEDGELWFDAATVSGDALTEDSGTGQLKADVKNGVATGSSGIMINAGDGFTFDSGQLKVDLVSGGGLKLDADGKVYVDANDFVAGNGLGVSSGNIVVTPGTGVRIDTDLRTDENDGLRVWNEQLEIYPGFGIEFNASGEVRLDNNDLVSDLAGNGLGTGDGILTVGASDGLAINSGQLEVDGGSGITVGSGGVRLNTDGTTTGTPNGALKVLAPGIAGNGLVDAKPVVTLEMYSGSGGTTDPSEGFHEYAPGTDVEITAYPGADYEFSSWGGDISSTNNPETITINSDMYVEAYFEPAGIESTTSTEETITSTDTDDLLHVDLGDGMTTISEKLNIDAGLGVSAPSGGLLSIDRSELYGSTISTYTDGDGIVRGETDFFPHAFEKIEYVTGSTIDAGDPTNYDHISVPRENEGDDIWVFVGMLRGNYDSYQNELEVIYEQGSTNQDWWSTVRLENVGGQDGTEEGKIDIRYLALTPKF